MRLNSLGNITLPALVLFFVGENAYFAVLLKFAMNSAVLIFPVASVQL